MAVSHPHGCVCGQFRTFHRVACEICLFISLLRIATRFRLGKLLWVKLGVLIHSRAILLFQQISFFIEMDQEKTYAALFVILSIPRSSVRAVISLYRGRSPIFSHAMMLTENPPKQCLKSVIHFARVNNRFAVI